MNNQKQIDQIKLWLGNGSINIFGRPFAGKDNQGNRLAKILDGNLVGGGEILRSDNMHETIKQNMKTGQLVPSEDYFNIVMPYISQKQFADRPLILSAVGRWHGEEDGVIKALNDAGHPLKAVIYLDISDEDSYQRWLVKESVNDRQSRLDDTLEVLQTRFAEFQTKTMPVIDYYKNLGMLIEINGKLSREEVNKSILDKLSDYINRASA